MPDNVMVVATRNRGKAAEFAAMLEPLGYAVKSLNDFDGLPEIVEDGDSFTANAVIKARTIAEVLGVPVTADDSGLCVDALGGAPGVYSARYAGEGATDADNNAKLLQELRKTAGDPETGAGLPPSYGPGRFVCALAVCRPDHAEPITTLGICEGVILAEPRGEQGFGYDPLFYLPEFGKTMAELTTEEKNGISHRAKALQLLLEKL